MGRRAVTLAALLVAGALVAAIGWRGGEPEEVASEGENAATAGATAGPEPAAAHDGAPGLAARGRRVILPTAGHRGPRVPEGGALDPWRPEAPAADPEKPEPPPPLPPLGPTDPGRIRVRLVAPDGSPVPRTAEVARGALATGLEWEGTVWVRDGVLVVEGVPDGEQQIVAEVGDWAPIVLSVRARHGLETDEGDVLLSRGHEIRGQVVDDEGRPVAGALVRGAGRRREARSDERGEFALDRLPAGPVDVEAEAEGFLSNEVEVQAGRDRTVRVVIERAARLEGTLLTPDGRPAPFVRLVLVDVGAAYRETLEPFAFRTDEDGTFEIDAVPGRYRVETGQEPAGVVLEEPLLAGGRTNRLVLRLPAER